MRNASAEEMAEGRRVLKEGWPPISIMFVTMERRVYGVVEDEEATEMGTECVEVERLGIDVVVPVKTERCCGWRMRSRSNEFVKADVVGAENSGTRVVVFTVVVLLNEGRGSIGGCGGIGDELREEDRKDWDNVDNKLLRLERIGCCRCGSSSSDGAVI
jgi:hypothetical protein